jgi:epoxyqueuosine reductase
LGVIGKNNLLITPEFGPRVRLRALFLDVALEPTGPADFDPCAGCDMPCRRACPQKAFRGGSYSRDLCDMQMGEDETNEVIIENWGNDDSPSTVRKYCRACELACPVAR